MADEFFLVNDFESLYFELSFDDLAFDASVYGGVTRFRYGDEAHRKAVLAYARSKLVKASKGGDGKASRWWNFQQNSRAFFPKLSSNMMLLNYAGVRRRWFPCFNECPMAQWGVTIVIPDDPTLNVSDDEEEEEGEEDEEEEEEEDEEEEDAALGAAEGNGAAVAAERDDAALAGAQAKGAVSKGKVSKKKAMATVEARRQNCVQTLVFACHKLSTRLHTRLWRGMVDVSLDVEEDFDKVMTEIKTPAGCRNWVLEMIEGRMREVLRKCINRFQSEEFSKACGFKASARPADLEEDDRVVVQCLYRQLVALLGNLSLSSLLFQVPPVAMVALTHPDRAVVDKWLKFFKELHGFTEVLEKTAQTDEDAKCFLDGMPWTKEVYCRENFIGLLETKFLREGIPDWLAELEISGRP